MPEPFSIAFRNMAPPFGADDLARDSAIALERSLGRTIACSVTVEKRHRQHSRGNLFRIEIELMVSGQRFVIHRDPPDGDTHELLHTAIAEAFSSTQRRLLERELVKSYEAKSAPMAGRQAHSALSPTERRRSRSNAAAAV
jgi:hypothetical protein